MGGDVGRSLTGLSEAVVVGREVRGSLIGLSEAVVVGGDVGRSLTGLSVAVVMGGDVGRSLIGLSSPIALTWSVGSLVGRDSLLLCPLTKLKTTSKLTFKTREYLILPALPVFR